MLVAVKVKSKGQVTVPLQIRSKLNINTGDTVFFEVRDNEIVIRKPKNLLDYEGFLGKVNLPDNEEELLTPDVAKWILERE
ncbi:MAG: AbrB/MazE/SpoVT family DNA-binding domain-containing protein [Synergistaceae bacterium]|nr:AbrB/MazE/SpoVT family DNA-binding domain-containing protein [Synergistaceae bacterium]